MPPARAGPSTAAMIGLVRSRWTMPPKPPRSVCEAGGVAGVDLLEVGAGAEHRRLAREDADPDAVVGLDLVDRVLDALGDGAVDGVAGLGPVDLDDRERSPLLEVDGHGVHPSHRAPVVAVIVQGPTAHRPLSCGGDGEIGRNLRYGERVEPRERVARGTDHGSDKGTGEATTWTTRPDTCSAPSARPTRSTAFHRLAARRLVHLPGMRCPLGRGHDRPLPGRGSVESVIAPRTPLSSLRRRRGPPGLSEPRLTARRAHAAA